MERVKKLRSKPKVMLVVYKRHSAKCPHKERSYRRCNCPCWAEGTVEGKYFRESLKTQTGREQRTSFANASKAVARTFAESVLRKRPKHSPEMPRLVACGHRACTNTSYCLSS